MRTPRLALYRQIVLLLFAGAAQAQNCPPVDTVRQKEEEKACRASGGEWGRFGAHAFLCGVYSCVPRTRDAGKSCRGRADCEYLCVSKREAPIGTPLEGVCAALATQFGCTVHVEAGKVVGRVCVD